MSPQYLGRYGDVVLESFPALEGLLQQLDRRLEEMPRGRNLFLLDFVARLGMHLSNAGRSPNLEEVVRRLVQLPQEEQVAWGKMLMALMSGLAVKHGLDEELLSRLQVNSEGQ
jgi:hypothetical protein